MKTTIKDHQQALLRLLAEFDRVCSKLDIPYVLYAGTLLGAARHGGFIPWDDDLDVLMLREDYDRFLRETEGVLDGERFFLQKEFSAHWPMFFSKLRLNGTTCLEAFHPKDPAMHQGVYMDIFPCDSASATAPGRWLQYAASRVVIAKCLDARGYDTDSKVKKLFMALCRLVPLRPMLRLTKRGKGDSGVVHSFLSAARSFDKNVFPRRYFTDRGLLEFEGRLYPVPRDWDALLGQLYGDYHILPSEAERQVKRHAILVDLEKSHEAYEHYRDGMEFAVHTRSIR